MPKAEIGWVRRTEDGAKIDVYVQHVGTRWLFYARSRRYEQWQAIEEPPLEDWLELLDAVERRAARRLLRPEEVDRVKRSIRERFPEAAV
jgi:hypothetical protein